MIVSSEYLLLSFESPGGVEEYELYPATRGEWTGVSWSREAIVTC